jgi:hypothetical protein
MCLNSGRKSSPQSRIQWASSTTVGGNNTVEEAYNYVFKPLLLELNKLGQPFPLTIVYCKLQWYSYGVHLSRRLLGQSIDLSVVQYHAQQPDEVSLNLYFLDLTSVNKIGQYYIF